MATSNGNDTIAWVAGDQQINGLGGIDTLDYSAATRGVNANLLAGSATILTTTSGHLTSQPAMLTGEFGFNAYALATSGVNLASTGEFNSLNGAAHSLISNFDGIGATQLNATTIRLFVNHEVANTVAPSYVVQAGTGQSLTLTGARIDYIDLDRATLAVKDTGLAYGKIYDIAGDLITSAADVGGGFSKFCSSSLHKANAFGSGQGSAEQLYFTGQESGGFGYALDTTKGELWAISAFGQGAYENTTQLDTGTTTSVAFLLTSDKQDSPLYIYVGNKNAGGDFLDRNGMRDGQLYYWKANNGDTNPSDFTSGHRAGTWEAIAVRDISKAGQSGFDSDGFKLTSTIAAEALAGGGFSFSRPEDCATNPGDGSEAVFAATGGRSGDMAGGLYTITTDFSAIGAPTAVVKLLYDGDADGAKALRNPDNLDWSSDGYIYVQEDRVVASLFGAGATNANDNEASIIRIDPATGDVTRIAHINRGAVPAGFVDSASTTVGTWESTGLLDVSALFGKAGGSVFLSNVQAHGVEPGLSLVGTANRDSQLVLLTAPGVTLHPAIEVDRLVSVENVTGTAFADVLVGDSKSNTLRGGGGGDKIYGNSGDDILRGDSSADQLDGGNGDDWLAGGTAGDTLRGGTGRDSAYYSYATAAVSVALDASLAAKGEAAGDIFYDIEDIHGSGFADVLVGNSGRNVIRGSAGADSINGKAGDDTLRGGTGADQLRGGTGSDNFRYIAKSELGDKIFDFSSSAVGNNDKFSFLDEVFGNLGVGSLATNEFQSSSSSKAATGTVRFFFETDTGILRYDDDGSGGHASVIVATVQSGAVVTRSDIDIVLT